MILQSNEIISHYNDLFHDAGGIVEAHLCAGL